MQHKLFKPSYNISDIHRLEFLRLAEILLESYCELSDYSKHTDYIIETKNGNICEKKNVFDLFFKKSSFFREKKIRLQKDISHVAPLLVWHAMGQSNQ